MADDPPADIIEIGGAPRDDRPRRPWRRWLPLVLVAGVALAIYARSNVDNQPEPPPATRSPSATAAAPPATPTATAPVVTEVGRPLLGIDAGWQLYGRGPGVVVRVDFAQGRITTTAVPTLSSSGPVSFLAGPDRVVVRPLDAVPGYVVPDGGPAAQATAGLAHSGPMLPGPDPTSVWVSDNVGERMLRVRFDGRPTNESLALPRGTNGFAEPDGGGYPLVSATSGAYTLRPDGVRRITTGDVLAVGAGHWLARECDAGLRCGTVLIEQRTGGRHAVRLGPDVADLSAGLTSADGTRAAMLVTGPREPRIHLLDLGSGRSDTVDLPLDPGFFPQQQMVWSPDGRWLFVLAGGGRLHAVEAATARTRQLDVALPHLDQLALRAG